MSHPVAIVGSGFSGSMLAARLAECGIASVRIDPSDRLGPAYATTFAGHLLNVRSGRMSAVEARPDDFLQWLEGQSPERADPDGFAPRRDYAAYIRDRLVRVEADHPGLMSRIDGRVCAAGGDGVTLEDGRQVLARAVVLATGNPPPGTAAAVALRVVPDPWVDRALDRIGLDDSLVIIGSGLTMVDVILSLLGRGWRGQAVALSRRGLLPRTHHARPDVGARPTPGILQGPLSHRLRAARAMAGHRGWRTMMEALRPLTADLWAAASPQERARFVRHLRPWWDVHRHRIAPSVGGIMTTLLADGRLSVIAGRAGRLVADDTGVRLDWTRRGMPCEPLSGDWLIDCSGPRHDPASDPLIAPLIAMGRARMDALGLGLDLDPQGRVRGADGQADGRLYVLGPPARAAFWETIAVPDIRRRIEDIVAALASPAA